MILVTFSAFFHPFQRLFLPSFPRKPPQITLLLLLVDEKDLELILDDWEEKAKMHVFPEKIGEVLHSKSVKFFPFQQVTPAREEVFWKWTFCLVRTIRFLFVFGS